jgi:hypothetical protein
MLMRPSRQMQEKQEYEVEKMSRTILTVALSLTCSLMAFAQRTEKQASGQGSNETSVSASKAGKTIHIQSGTRLAAELQNTIDARKVKPGDRVVFKTTDSIKSNGQTIVKRGVRLIGHVTEVEQQTKGNQQSSIGLVFDRLQNGSLEIPISATISSITPGRARARANGEDLFGSDADARSTISARSSTSAQRTSASSGESGGLLGGTVGGVIGSTTSTAGSVVDGTTATVGSTASSTTGVASAATTGLTGSLGRIQISESSSTSSEGSSTLSLQGGNLRLEKGTTFNLVVNQSVKASNSKDQ